jgi:hypothetical protein
MTKQIERASGLTTNWQNLIFLSKLYTRGRDLNTKTLTYLQPFCFCHPAFLLPVSLTKHKLPFGQGEPLNVPPHRDRGMGHLQVPTLSECC